MGAAAGVPRVGSFVLLLPGLPACSRFSQSVFPPRREGGLCGLYSSCFSDKTIMLWCKSNPVFNIFSMKACRSTDAKGREDSRCWRRGGSPWKLFSLNSHIRGTELVGGDEGNEKAKREDLFSFLVSQNCCRNLR